MKKFGAFIFDLEQSRLLREDTKEEVEIDHKLVELLSLFLQQPNTILSRQTLLDNLWAGSIVTDNAINKLVANLRKVLVDDAKQPEYIQTVPKRGYRFVSKVTEIDSTSDMNLSQNSSNQSNPNDDHTTKKQKTLSRKQASYSLVSVFLIVLGFYFWQVLSDKKSFNNSHSIALTRAMGAEQSAHMHPNNQHLFYLKTNHTSAQYELWVKNIDNAIIKQVDIGPARISDVITVIAEEAGKTKLLYLYKSPRDCGVYQAVLSGSNDKIQTWSKLFDCAGKRIKDFAYDALQNTLYYSAQPKNFWPNQVYAFNLSTEQQLLVTQAEPKGWGHHNIDMSPDGTKLLILSTNSDYKTQALSLNLLTNKITKGIKFSQPVTEAIWHHDSRQIYYYAEAPAQQIMQSEFNGENATLVVSASEQLSSRMSRFPDGKNIVFSTERKNVNNRWLVSQGKVGNVDNSTVDDNYPALFHHSEQYLFISKRSGRNQLFLADYGDKQAKIVTNFSEAHWLGYLVVAADDKSVLLNVDNKVYQIAVDQLDPAQPLSSLANTQLVYSSQNPIIALDWLSKDKVAVTAVKNATPELVVIDLLDRSAKQLKGQWAYGLSDSADSKHSYLIEQQSNSLYRIDLLGSANDSLDKPYKLDDIQIALPDDFYHVKIDNHTLYYVTTENHNEYLHAVSLSDNGLINKHLINAFSSYDISKGNIMLSDMQKLEGDVFRTVL